MSPPSPAREHRSLEDAGRLARYRFLEELAAALGPAAFIATAHTADDVAETDAPAHGARQRPAWAARDPGAARADRSPAARRAATATCATALDEAGIAYLLDPTNDDASAAARNRVRAEVLPALERLNPARGRGASSGWPGSRRTTTTPLDAIAAAELARRRNRTGASTGVEPPARAIGRRVLRLAIGEPSPSAERIEALLDAAEGPRGGLDHRARRRPQRIGPGPANHAQSG